MITVFERIPDVFVQHYDFEFQVWAREFRQRGPTASIRLEKQPGQIAILDARGQPVGAEVWLSAEVDRSQPQNPRVVIRPLDEQNEETIKRHVGEMARHWLS